MEIPEENDPESRVCFLTNAARFRLLPAMILVLGMLAATGVSADDEGEQIAREKAEGKSLAKVPGYSLKVGGTLFTGFEVTDHDQVGRPDQSGPDREEAGFQISRAYLNVSGRVDEGEFKGWAFQITTDVARSAGMGDGCGTSCSENNDANVFLKYAYVDVPVPYLDGNFGTNFFRLGLQQPPPFHGQGPVSLLKNWNYRFVADAPTSAVGMTPSADQGIGFVHGNPYFGLHVLLANGEGFHKVNAQEIRNQSRSDLEKGAGDSYGLHFYGLASIIPTGKNKTISWSINFPFRLHNVAGIEEDETRYLAADVSAAPATYDIIYREGDARAKRDVDYGVETDLKIDLGEFDFTLGVGGVARIDRRGSVTDRRFRPDSTGALQVETTRTDVRDASGFANYMYAHVRWKYFGAFGRIIHGTSTDSLSERFSPIDKTPWMIQALKLDAVDRVYGNLALSTADNNIDHGEGRYYSVIYGLTFYPSARASFFRVAVGVSELWGWNKTGREYRTNVFERYSGSGLASANTDSVSTQIENNTAVKAALGLGAGETLVLNEYIGSKIDTKQLFLRAELQF